jgi:phage tail-like protein
MADSSGRGSDPLVAFVFRLEIEGKLAGYFTECSGIGSENDVIRQKIVDVNGHEAEQVLPGRLKWTDVTLKRGITAKMDIWDWRTQVIKGTLGDARAPVSIILCDRDYTDVARWDFVNAWPSKVSGPTVKADSNELGIEEVVIVHEGMERKS